MSTVDIIIPVFNQLEYTRLSVESILNNILPLHLILIDNASNEMTSNYFKDIQKKTPPHIKVTVITNKINQGWLKAINQGIAISSAPHVVFANNDILLYPGTLEEMLSISAQRFNIGLINPDSNDFKENGTATTPPDLITLAKLLDSKKGRWVERAHITGFFVLIKREVIQAIGGFDPVYDPGYFEELDYSERARRSGFTCVRALGAYVHHFGKKTFLSSDRVKLNDAHRLIFIQKWQEPSWYALFVDRKLIMDPVKWEKVKNALSDEIRKQTAYIYVFFPLSYRLFVSEQHDNFRLRKGIPGLRFFSMVLWLILRRLNSKKRISKIFVSNNSYFFLLSHLQPLHRAELCLLNL